MSKNKGKTAEVLLQEALVPAKEQPYELPKNWNWVYLGGVVDFNGGGTPSKSISSYWNGDIPWASVKDVKGRYLETTQDFITDEGLKNSSANIADINELLLITRMSPGKSVISKVKTAINQDLKIVRPKIKIMPFFLWMYFNVNIALIEHMSTGSTVKGIQITKLNEMKFPLPPINEQKRIADKVERLLNKINQAKQLIEEAKETFELRRAAILDKAFRGELTANWRDETKNINFPPVIESLFKTTESNEIPNNWAITNFDSIAANERYALAIGPFGSNLKVTDYREEGVPLIFVRNIRSSNYGLDNKFVSEEKAEELKAHMVESGDILITKMGDPPGDVDICPEIIEKAIITADCIKVRVNTEIVNRKYLLYAIKSDFVQSQIRRESKGVAQQKISLQAFRKMNVIIAPYEEQLKIVKELEGLMEKEKGSIENLELMEGKLNSLEQAILSKAFRGQLGTSDPYEENAIDFLQQAK